jgi:hypothetical protein
MIETSQIAALALDYNTDREDLRMPEYGRHVQSMIAYCLTLPDREHRTKVANSIIDVIGNLNPGLRDNPDYRHKLCRVPLPHPHEGKAKWEAGCRALPSKEPEPPLLWQYSPEFDLHRRRYGGLGGARCHGVGHCQSNEARLFILEQGQCGRRSHLCRAPDFVRGPFGPRKSRPFRKPGSRLAECSLAYPHQEEAQA